MRKQAQLYTALILLGACGLAWYGYRSHLDARLLRGDPDRLMADASLMHYGVAHGATAYAAHCATCHGPTGAGDATRGVPNLSDNDWLYGAGMVSEIERVVAYGIRSDNPKAWNLARMPAFAHLHPSASEPKIPPLQPGNIRDVIEYLLYLQHKPADAEAAIRGAQVYNNTGGCYDCHSTDAAGDSAIGAPNLIDNITLYGDGTRDALFASIADGRQGVCPAWIDKLKPITLREIALYVHSLSHPPGGQVSPAPGSQASHPPGGQHARAQTTASASPPHG